MAKRQSRQIELHRTTLELPVPMWHEFYDKCTEEGITPTCILNSVIEAILNGDIQVTEPPKSDKLRRVFILLEGETADDTLRVVLKGKDGQVLNPTPIREY